MCGDGGCVAFIVVVCLLGGGSAWVNSGVCLLGCVCCGEA